MNRFDYRSAFRAAIDRVHSEGRYRVFADLKRKQGAFPRASFTHADGREQDVIVWCSNDYLGQGQNPAVMQAMHDAIDAVGSGSGGTRNISGTTHYHVELEREIADLHGKPGALLFTSGYVANDATLATLAKVAAGADRFFRRFEPRLDDRGDQARRVRAAHLPPQRP